MIGTMFTFDRIARRSRCNFLTWEGLTNRAIANYNAKVQQLAAKDAEQRGAVAAAEQEQKTHQMLARQNVVMSAGGVSSATGSPLEIMTEAAGMGELDALRILNNAQRQAAGLEGQADLERYKGRTALAAGAFNAAGSLMTGAGTGAYYWSKFFSKKAPATSRNDNSYFDTED